MNEHKSLLELDKTVVSWLEENDTATVEAFVRMMNTEYGTDDMIKRFGTVVFKEK